MSAPVFRRSTSHPVHIIDHPLKLAVYDARPHWLGYVQKDALEERSGIFGVLKLLSLELPFDEREQKTVTGG